MITRTEAMLAAKRVAAWPRHMRTWLLELPASEREHILLLVALLDATPEEP